MQVVVIDDRADWMKKEDVWWVCFSRCPLYKKCSSHFGSNCKRLGGDKIPKVRDNDGSN
ncbi:hypothetical protein JOC94_004190 [Bacillus thermophilus]|uniref:Uncharacterized protein n=1 Tax=Siminovitchia thermophila TaxID=1245522 RepID=A0ABS2RCW1_9BACI|nr:hypothetical protein [Siminovitchia thermophila]